MAQRGVDALVRVDFTEEPSELTEQLMVPMGVHQGGARDTELPSSDNVGQDQYRQLKCYGPPKEPP